MNYFFRTRKSNPNHDPKNGEFTSGSGGGGSGDGDHVRHRLLAALTQYDERQSKKPGHNPHALPQYMEAMDNVVADIKNGAPVRDAIVAAFNGRLAAALLRATGQSAYTRQDAMGDMSGYSPVAKK